MARILSLKCLDNPRARDPKPVTLTAIIGAETTGIAPATVYTERLFHAVRAFKRHSSPAYMIRCPNGRVLLASVKGRDGARWYALGTGSVMYWMTPKQFDELEHELGEACDGY